VHRVDVAAHHRIEVLRRTRLRDPSPQLQRSPTLDQEHRSPVAIRGKVHELRDHEDSDVLLEASEDDALPLRNGGESITQRAQVRRVGVVAPSHA
jgi:hypothetical protein